MGDRKLPNFALGRILFRPLVHKHPGHMFRPILETERDFPRFRRFICIGRDPKGASPISRSPPSVVFQNFQVIIKKDTDAIAGKELLITACAVYLVCRFDKNNRQIFATSQSQLTHATVRRQFQNILISLDPSTIFLYFDNAIFDIISAVYIITFPAPAERD